jgi:hypothetical protein
MRSFAIGCLLVLFALGASAGEPTRLPFAPLEGAAPGDWSCFMTESQSHYRDTNRRSYFSWRVTEVTSATVAVEVETCSLNPDIGDMCSPDCEPKKKIVRFARGEPATVRAYLETLGWTGVADEATMMKEKRTVAGRAFECSRVTCDVRGATVTLWVSEEARPLGLVAYRVETPVDCKRHPGEKQVIAGELQGRVDARGSFGVDGARLYTRENNHYSSPDLAPAGCH